MEIYVKIISFPYCLFPFVFNHIHWFYPYRRVKHSNWWRHRL